MALDSLQGRRLQSGKLLLGENYVEEILVDRVGVKLQMRDFMLLDSADKCTAEESHLQFGFYEGDLELYILLLHLALLTISCLLISFYL